MDHFKVKEPAVFANYRNLVQPDHIEYYNRAKNFKCPFHGTCRSFNYPYHESPQHLAEGYNAVSTTKGRYILLKNANLVFGFRQTEHNLYIGLYDGLVPRVESLLPDVHEGLPEFSYDYINRVNDWPDWLIIRHSKNRTEISVDNIKFIYGQNLFRGEINNVVSIEIDGRNLTWGSNDFRISIRDLDAAHSIVEGLCAERLLMIPGNMLKASFIIIGQHKNKEYSLYGPGLFICGPILQIGQFNERLIEGYYHDMSTQMKGKFLYNTLVEGVELEQTKDYRLFRSVSGVEYVINFDQQMKFSGSFQVGYLRLPGSFSVENVLLSPHDLKLYSGFGKLIEDACGYSVLHGKIMFIHKGSFIDLEPITLSLF